jgi:hypothetical protein
VIALIPIFSGFYVSGGQLTPPYLYQIINSGSGVLSRDRICFIRVELLVTNFLAFGSILDYVRAQECD